MLFSSLVVSVAFSRLLHVGRRRVGELFRRRRRGCWLISPLLSRRGTGRLGALFISHHTHHCRPHCLMRSTRTLCIYMCFSSYKVCMMPLICHVKPFGTFTFLMTDQSKTNKQSSIVKKEGIRYGSLTNKCGVCVCVTSVPSLVYLLEGFARGTRQWQRWNIHLQTCSFSCVAVNVTDAR